MTFVSKHLICAWMMVLMAAPASFGQVGSPWEPYSNNAEPYAPSPHSDATRDVYFCRVLDSGTFYFGHVTTEDYVCRYVRNGLSALNFTYEMLVDPAVVWINSSNGASAADAYPTATTSKICVAQAPTGVTGAYPVPGELRQGSDSCEISFRDKVYRLKSYQALRKPWGGGANGSLPTHAWQMGMDGSIRIYICRAIVPDGKLRIGKIFTGATGCTIALPSPGGVTVQPNYEVLVNFPGTWSSSLITSDGFVGALNFIPNAREKSIVCRATPPAGGSSQHAGYYSNGCRMEYGGAAYTRTSFEILYPQITPVPTEPCTYAVSPTSANLPAAGGTAILEVTTQGACAWGVTGLPAWLGLAPYAEGSGPLGVTAQANPGPARSATLQVAGKTVTINQEGVCTYTITPLSSGFNASGGAGSINVTASSPSCSWSIANIPNWITVQSPSFPAMGSRTVNFTVVPNTGATRNFAVVVGNTTANITQSPPSCNVNTYTISPTIENLPGSGATGSVQINVPGACPWTASTTAAWVTLPVTSGAGVRTISYTVAANPTSTPRSALLVAAGQVLTINQAGAPAGLSGLRFVPIEPCRLVETRAEYNYEGRTGSFGPPFLAAGETRTIAPSASSVCPGIPANAQAFVLNVTVVPRGTLDFVTVFPNGEVRPNYWTLRSPDGLTVANSAIVKAGAANSISLYTSHPADLIVDISGYFADVPGGYVFYPLTPCRVVETRAAYRTPPGPFGPPSLPAQTGRSFRFPNNGYCTVPAGAKAYSVTITVVPPGPLAFLKAWPAGSAQPNVSSMNSPAGRVLANSVIVPANADGSIDLYAYNNTDVIVDINGYFGTDDGINGLFYFPLRQCRVLQTENLPLLPSNGPVMESESTRTVSISSSSCAGIAPNAKGYSLNATVIPGGSPMPFLTVWPTGQSQPNASVINAFEGQTVSAGFLVPAGANGSVNIYAYRRTHLALEISGYFGR